MSEEEKPKKRVGTWEEYYACKAKKIGQVLKAVLLICGATILFVGLLIYTTSIFIVIALLVATMIAYFKSLSIFESVSEIPHILPPTHQNLASSLPAQDVLVRASAEPTEEAGKTLLRATLADSETPVEELLRPTSQRE